MVIDWVIYLIEDRFTWNVGLLDAFTSLPNFEHFVTPVIFGYVGGQSLEKNGQKVLIAAISRISRHRAGVRYRRRGVNTKGHAAIEVETELIVQTEKYTSSYLQLRGSIPLFWRQRLEDGVALFPSMDLSKSESPQSLEALRTHFSVLKKLYQRPISVIDLLPKEEHISTIYENACKSIKDSVSYRRVNVLSVDILRGTYFKSFHDGNRRLILSQQSVIHR